MPLYSVLIVIHNIQLLRNFCEKKVTFANSGKKHSQGLMLERWRLSQLKALTWTFRSQTVYALNMNTGEHMRT